MWRTSAARTAISSSFLESLGCRVDTIDFPVTNDNGLRGAWALKQALNSSVEIHAMDLDRIFRLPAESYGMALFLGILYHLKNPDELLDLFRSRHEKIALTQRRDHLRLRVNR